MEWIVEFLAYLTCIWIGAGAGFLMAAIFMAGHD